MCHSADSRPPRASGATGVAATADLVLTAGDGNCFMAFTARAVVPSGAGMIVMPDVRGLHRFYKNLAVRFAEIGVDAVAIDYFGRTASDDDRCEAFEYVPHVRRMTPATVTADVAAARDYLRSAAGGGVERVYTTGFCLGGGHSWRQSADLPGLAGCIGFYGRPEAAQGAADRMSAPLLMIVAGQDAHIAVADVRAVADGARAAGVDAQVVVYDAPHSFFDRSFAQHAADCADAWERIKSFVAA